MCESIFMGLKRNGALNSPGCPQCSASVVRVCVKPALFISLETGCLESFGAWREYSAVNHTPYGERQGV